MEANWNAAEEKAIAETMAGGLGRIEAIRHLRSSWLIGESAPPGWKLNRPMPKGNPRHGTATLPSPEVKRDVIGTALCAGCGKLFNPSRPDNRTCSDRCRKLTSRRARVASPKTHEEVA
jgi:hypothetical protein